MPAHYAIGDRSAEAGDTGIGDQGENGDEAEPSPPGGKAVARGWQGGGKGGLEPLPLAAMARLATDVEPGLGQAPSGPKLRRTQAPTTGSDAFQILCPGSMPRATPSTWTMVFWRRTSSGRIAMPNVCV